MENLTRILIVEDEPLIAEMLRDWVTELGHEVIGPAGSNAAALELLAKGPVAGAILDVTIADGHSYEVARALQRLGAPFVFATGHGAESIDPEFKDVPTLQKPFDFDALAMVIAGIARAPG
ncbi:MAG: response regulator [Hyphomicrobiaceae bacterium]|nr:response regulator [Hyphomicrobiaceae bacterium]